MTQEFWSYRQNCNSLLMCWLGVYKHPTHFYQNARSVGKFNKGKAREVVFIYVWKGI